MTTVLLSAYGREAKEAKKVLLQVVCCMSAIPILVSHTVIALVAPHSLFGLVLCMLWL